MSDLCEFDPSSENDPRSQIVHMKKIQAEGLELFIKKNADYGNSYKQYGLIGVLVRLQDKINRALNITKNGIQVKDESLRDTLIDLHNYAAMALMETESEPSISLNVASASATQNQPLPSIQIQSEQSRVRRSISDPPFKNSDAYEECNHRNINLR